MAQESKYWDYVPSFPAAVIISAAFAILTIFHAVKFFKTRTWFCVPLLIGGILEAIGFACRGVGNKNMFILMPYLLQSLFILLAPIFFAATVYMILSRLIRSTGAEEHSLVRVTWLTKIFVGGDALCFAVQAGGGAILSGAKTSKTKKLGENVILGGLIFQIVVFAFFTVVASVFHCRINAQPTGRSRTSTVNFDQFIRMLYIVSGLITFRNLFRVIEYAMGEEGYLLANEWPIYIFDAVPMVLVLAVCSRWYVGSFDTQFHGSHVGLSQLESGDQPLNQRRDHK